MESLSAQRTEDGKTSPRLNPREVSRRRWTPLEDSKLCQLVASYGSSLPKWETIAKEFPGRSRNSCRYRWEKLSRDKEKWGPAFCSPGFPMPFYVAPPYNYWGCVVPVLSPWDMNMMQWVPTPSGYHSTENEGGEEKSLWIPKPLRIDDPEHEAAKISIWETLGIKNDQICVAGHVNGGGGGMFKEFQSKNKAIEEASSPASSKSVN